MDATTLVGRLRGDPRFRRAALLDADAIIDAHSIDWVLLMAASKLMAVDRWRDSQAGRQEHGALFALLAAARRQ